MIALLLAPCRWFADFWTKPIRAELMITSNAWSWERLFLLSVSSTCSQWRSWALAGRRSITSLISGP